MTSSSSANYDVFLSFRGTDTRNNFTSHLHKALCDNNVKVFIDNSIHRGEEITSFLEGIIEGVKLSIIVFSSDYASSTFCLDEMVKIMECKETKAQIVLPIFYKVYPSEETYQEAFTTHRDKFKGKRKRREEIVDQETKVERWKSSLHKAFNLAGWHIDDFKCRQCFLYCSLFPEDHKFEREDLIEYWIAERLIDELDSKQEEFDKGNVILDELIHSSLLGNHVEFLTKISMHDVIRDMAHIIVQDGSQFQYPFESVQVLNETMLKSFPNSVPHFSKLKTLVLLGYNIKVLSNCFFSNMQSLNILHMTSTSVISIPHSITNLRNLRVLIISFCRDLRYIPLLVGLENLRHLEISSNLRLEEIPRGIEKLVNLRVLDLSRNAFHSTLSLTCVVDKLSHLQTLHLKDNKVELEAEALISLEKLETLCISFYNLHKLNSYVKSGHWRRLLDYQIAYGGWNYRNSKKVMTFKPIRDIKEWEGGSGIILPDDIQNLHLEGWERQMFYVLKNPTYDDLTLTIRMSDSRYLLTVDLAQKLLYNVQELHIEFCMESEEIISVEEEWANQSNYIEYPTMVLPNLKKLSLSGLLNLKSIYRGRMVCHSLELIKIDQWCDKVERPPFYMEKEENKQNPSIRLRGFTIFHPNEKLSVSKRWWDSLQWDNPNAESIYDLIEFEQNQ